MHTVFIFSLVTITTLILKNPFLAMAGGCFLSAWDDPYKGTASVSAFCLATVLRDNPDQLVWAGLISAFYYVVVLLGVTRSLDQELLVGFVLAGAAYLWIGGTKNEEE